MDPLAGSDPKANSLLGPGQEDALSPVKRGNIALSATEKVMVLNVYNYLIKEKLAIAKEELPNKIKRRDRIPKMFRKNDCANKAAEMLGIGHSTIYKVIREYKENSTFKSPMKTGPRRNFKDKLDTAQFSAIKEKVNKMLCNKDTLSIKKVLQAVNDDPYLPNFSSSTMRKILKHLGITF